MSPYLLLVLAYLVGATPTSHWVGKAVYGVDLTKEGSGNLGATNVYRVLGWRAAVPVAVVDVLKGWLPVALFPGLDSSPEWGWALAYGAAAIVGHVFSVWVRFRGGKGVATSSGVFLALAPTAVLVGLGVWLLVVLVVRMVSVASLSAVLVIPLVILLGDHPGGPPLFWFTVALAAFVFWAHRSNLRRLLKGQEPRIRGGRASPSGGPGNRCRPRARTGCGKPSRRSRSVTGRAAPVGVVGAGSWGTALARLLAGNGHPVRLWALEEEVVRQIRERRENAMYLPGVSLPAKLRSTNRLEEVVAEADVVVSVVPSQFVFEVMSRAAPRIHADALVVSATKGIELSTLRRMDEVMASVLSTPQMERFTVLSGPSFASEVAREMPTAVVVASHSEEARLRAQALFQTSYLRVYTNPDVIGVQLAGALKNVIALAAGVTAGLGFGHNTRAALITRGLAEITRLGVALGAQKSTFSGLAGMGDLVLTCTGELSRNRTVGYRLGLGEPLDEILADMKSVAEGVRTAPAVHDLARQTGVEMPICQEVYAILVDGRSPGEALQNLMLREPKPEEWY